MLHAKKSHNYPEFIFSLLGSSHLLVFQGIQKINISAMVGTLIHTSAIAHC